MMIADETHIAAPRAARFPALTPQDDGATSLVSPATYDERAILLRHGVTLHAALAHVNWAAALKAETSFDRERLFTAAARRARRAQRNLHSAKA